MNENGMFDMPMTDPVPTPFTVYMADKKPVWEAIVKRHDLQPIPYEQISSWPFADAILRQQEFDNITSTIKARRAGFHDCIDTEDMFREFFADLRKNRIIPCDGYHQAPELSIGWHFPKTP